MAPYFNQQTNEVNPDSDDLYTEPELSAPLTEQAQREQAAREARDRIGVGKKPEPTPAEDGERPEGHRDTAQFGREEYERIRSAALGDPLHPLNDSRHPDHELTVEKYLRLGMMADGKDYDDPEENQLIGMLHDARILRPEDTPPVTIPRLSDEAREAFDLGPADADAVVEHQEELIGLADASGLPRYHVESLFQDVGAAFEDFARDADADTPEAGMAELVRTEGGRARQIATDAQALVQVLHESGNPNLIAAAEDLVALSNHPRVLIGAARLYQELTNLPPQGPWEQILLGAGAKWAEGQSAAKARAAKAAKADEAPDDHVVSHGGRP